MTNFEKIAARSPEKPSQFIAWHNDVPYLAKFTPFGAGYFHRIEFQEGDKDFRNTLADDPRELFVDPEDIAVAGSAADYLESVLKTAAA